MARRGRERDSKYLRLTGLWESKKDGLYTGKLRVEDISKLIDKADEAEKEGQPLVFFLWTNEDKDSRKDPDFTLQVSVAEDRGGNSRNRGRDRDREEDQEEEEENEERSSRRTSRNKKDSRSKNNKKDSDW